MKRHSQRLLGVALMALAACSPSSGDGAKSAGSGSAAIAASPRGPAIRTSEAAGIESAAASSSSAAASSSSASPSKPSGVQRIAFVGDISTSLFVQNYLDGDAKPNPPVDADYPFHFVAERLRSYDLMVGNLECVVSPRGARTRKFPLRGSLKTPGLLVDAGFDVVNVANNHQNDLGLDAYNDALTRLRAAGLAISGDMFSGHDPILVRDVGPLKIAIVGIYNKKRTEAEELVREAKKRAPIVIAFLHWGDDYHSRVTESQRTLGHAIIDAGAECIVGAHAHVVQPEEIYHDKLIAYGIGNFVFTGMAARGTHNGALIELDVSEGGVVAHRYRRVNVDDQGIPKFTSEDATPDPYVDPPLDAPQTEPVPTPAKI